MTITRDTDYKEKLRLILEALKEKKAKEIISIDLVKVENAICDYFVICHGDSTTQVDALQKAVHRKLKEKLKSGPHHIEGTENSLWVLMDYSDIVVHIFLNEQRPFYNLEDLWADGKLEHVADD